MQKDKRKGGRPEKPEEEKRKYNITVALTKSEIEKVREGAKRHGQKPNTFLRQLALNRRLPPQIRPKIDHDTYITLTNTGNLLAGFIKKQNNLEIAKTLSQLKKQLNELRLELIK